jgi:hypothetical protein
VLAALVRGIGLTAGARLGARLSGLEPSLARRIPLGMYPQAGIAIGLANLVREQFRPWGEAASTLLLGTIVVNEMVGPVLFRSALVRAGEVGLREGEPAVPAPAAVADGTAPR